MKTARRGIVLAILMLTGCGGEDGRDEPGADAAAGSDGAVGSGSGQVASGGAGGGAASSTGSGASSAGSGGGSLDCSGAAAELCALPSGHWFEAVGSHLEDVKADPATFPWVGQGEGISGIMNDWAGGAFDTKRNRLYVTGGGHNGYFGNEIYAFDLNSMAWIRLNDPEPIVGDECPDPATSWCAIHTYDGLEYIPPPIDRFLAVGGWGAPNTYSLDLETLSWEVLPLAEHDDTARTGAFSAYDAVTQAVWVGKGTIHEYLPATKQWGASSSYDNDIYWTLCLNMAADPDRHRLVAVGAGKVYYWDLSGDGPIEAVLVPTTGDNAIVEGNIGVAFDPVGSRLIAWNGGAEVFALDLDAWSWSKIGPADDNTVVPTAANGNGTYGRFQYVPDAHALVVVNHVAENVYLYKL